MALEQILKDGSETGETAANKINASFDLVDTSVQVIEGSITKTVASESSASPETFDFPNLVEALRSLEHIQSYSIQILLDDGIHYPVLNGTTELSASNSEVNTYNFSCALLSLSSINSDSSLVTVILPPSITTITNQHPFIIGCNNEISISSITFDIAVDGGDISLSQTYGILFTSTKLINFWDCIFKSTSTIKPVRLLEGRVLKIEIGGCSFTSCTQQAIVTNGDILAIRSNSSFTDCVTISNSNPFRFGQEYFIDSSTLLTNTNISNTALNKFDDSFSIIYYNPITNGWTGTTADRPALTVANEKPYFDTTLGKPVWFNGTNWVDAVGTIV